MSQGSMSHNHIQLYFSHAVEYLAQKLDEQLALERQHTHNILKPSEVIVPNGNMQKYLQLFMAQQHGVCANVAFPFLETGLFQAMRQVNGGDGVTMLNHNQLALKIWQLLSQPDALDGDIYQPILHYFSERDAAALASKKHWQLSQRLALLLMDYELKRPEMILSWMQGKLVFQESKDLALRALERMQCDLYQQVLSAQTADDPSLTLFQLWHRCDWSKVSQTHRGSLHLFTPTRLSQFHRQLLCDLARCHDIHIYQLNVCAEYWQDMQTEGEDIWHRRLMAQQVKVTDAEGNRKDEWHDPESFFELDGALTENPLLKAWGKPGREALKLYSQLEEDAIHFDVDFSDEWLDSEQDRNHGLLHAVQDAILFRAQGEGGIRTPNALTSLQITQAPTIYREVEAVYHNILWNLQQSPELQPSDVAVLVTDMDRYRFVIEQVFGEAGRQLGTHLPYALVDASVTVESVYARGVLGFFDLLAHDFLRAEVFQWLRNPCVMTALQIEVGDWEHWLAAASHLGIFAGFERLYASLSDTDDSCDGISQRFTWRQGLERLHLSLANGALDHSLMDAESIGQFSVLLDELQQHSLWMQSKHRASTWENKLNRLFEVFLAIPDDLPKEQAVASALAQSLAKLSAQVGDMALGVHDIRNFLEAELNDLSASKGHYLTGGVVCAALQPMRPIPFKITYVLGMDAPSFPGGLRNDTLDLSNRSRRIGDINPIENKQYLFLETLMCSRDKLYLSYVGQNISKAETVDRSPVLDELATFAESFIDKTALSLKNFPETCLSLRGEDQALFRFDESSCSDMGVHYSLMDYLLAVFRHNPEQAYSVAQSLATEGQSIQQEQANQFIRLMEAQQVEKAKETQPKPTERIDIDIKDLAQFLEDAQIEMMQRQGMVLKHPEQEALVPHEPFELNGLDKHILYQEAVWEVVNTQGKVSLQEAMNKAYRAHAIKSNMPVEFYADIDQLVKGHDADALDAMVASLDKFQPCDGPIQVGQAWVEHTPIKRLPAIEITLANGVAVQLHGTIDGLFEGQGSLQAQLVISGGKVSGWNKKVIRPFLNWCVLQLSAGVQVAEAMDVHLFYRDKCQQKSLRFWATDQVSFSGPAHIKRYLTEVLTDYLNHDGKHLSIGDVGSSVTAPSCQGSEQVIKYTHSYKNHAFAYELSSISEVDQVNIQQNYEQTDPYPSYQEVANLIEADHLDGVLKVMHRRFWPLHAMMLAKLPENKASEEVVK